MKHLLTYIPLALLVAFTGAVLHYFNHPTLDAVITTSILSIFCGVCEAYYWHLKMRSKELIHNEHVFLTLLRCGFFLLLFRHTDILTTLGCIGLFPLLHDGFYYMIRNQITPGIYPLGFTDTSTTSTAWLTMNFNMRLILALIGGGLIVIGMI